MHWWQLVKRGDEVITAPNSFIASAAAIAHVGAIPVFADVEPNQNISPDCIREKLTKKTKAIMPVHLTGRPCKMDEINEIAGSAGIAVIEDAAQSIGSEYKRKNWWYGDFGCFSAHPLKNLNAIGDGGFLTPMIVQLQLKSGRHEIMVWSIEQKHPNGGWFPEWTHCKQRYCPTD